MAIAYGPTTTPHVFLFDNQRILRFCGRIDEMENPYEKATQHDTRNAILALLEEKPVDVVETDLNGIKELLANNSKTYRLVNVWATWCGPCVIEFPEFVTIQRMYGARDFEFVSISTDGINKKEKVLDFLKSKGAATKNLLYLGEDKYPLIETVNKNWSGAMPFTMLIAPGGEIVYKKSGS